jgi:hypothetical protein
VFESEFTRKTPCAWLGVLQKIRARVVQRPDRAGVYFQDQVFRAGASSAVGLSKRSCCVESHALLMSIHSQRFSHFIIWYRFIIAGSRQNGFGLAAYFDLQVWG